MKSERMETRENGDLVARSMRRRVENYFREGSWPRLKPPAFAVWVALMTFSVHGVAVSVSRRRLMTMLGARSKGTVDRAIKELLLKGYLTKLETDEPPQCPASYLIALQPSLAEAPPAEPQGPLYNQEECIAQSLDLERQAEIVLAELFGGTEKAG